MRSTLGLAFVIATVAFLGGCDALGIESAEKIAAAREADGKAIGAACRHSARALEDCFAIYKKADRAAIFAGWRDMNDYMRENKIEPVAPQATAQLALAGKVGRGRSEDSSADDPSKAAGRR